MSGVSIQNAGLLLTNYLDGVDDTLQNTSRLRSRIRRNNKWTGDHLEWRVHVRRSGAVGNTEDGGATPVPNKQTYVPAKTYRKFMVGSIRLTDGVKAAGSGGRAVAKSVLESEMEGLFKELDLYDNGMGYRDGTGVVANVTANIAGTTLTVDDSRMLWEGLTFEIYDTTLTTKRGEVVVEQQNSDPSGDNATVTLQATLAGVVNTDKVVWKGSLNRAITGLDLLVDDAASTFQNVNAATYPHYTSLVMDNGGTLRDLTPSLFRQMLAGLAQKSGTDKISRSALTNVWEGVNVEELYEGEIRLSPESRVAGFVIASFHSAAGRIDVETDPLALYNKMFFVDWSQLYRGVQQRLSWRRQGDSIFTISQDFLNMTATALEICDYYIRERHTSGKLEDLNETRSTMYG